MIINTDEIKNIYVAKQFCDKVTKDMNLLIFKDEYKMINELGEKADYAGLEHPQRRAAGRRRPI